MPELVHATCVAIGKAGILIIGPPGSGKSDLALRLIDQPGFGISGELKRAELVSDDQVLIERHGDYLVASPPAAIAGKLEIRGLGIVDVPHAGPVGLRFVVRLAEASRIERLPELETQRHRLLGISLPLFEIDPRQPSAPARVRAAAGVRNIFWTSPGGV